MPYQENGAGNSKTVLNTTVTAGGVTYYLNETESAALGDVNGKSVTLGVSIPSGMPSGYVPADGYGQGNFCKAGTAVHTPTGWKVTSNDNRFIVEKEGAFPEEFVDGAVAFIGFAAA